MIICKEYVIDHFISLQNILHYNSLQNLFKPSSEMNYNSLTPLRQTLAADWLQLIQTLLYKSGCGFVILSIKPSTSEPISSGVQLVWAGLPLPYTHHACLLLVANNLLPATSSVHHPPMH